MFIVYHFTQKIKIKPFKFSVLSRRRVFECHKMQIFVVGMIFSQEMVPSHFVVSLHEIYWMKISKCPVLKHTQTLLAIIGRLNNRTAADMQLTSILTIDRQLAVTKKRREKCKIQRFFFFECVFYVFMVRKPWKSKATTIINTPQKDAINLPKSRGHNSNFARSRERESIPYAQFLCLLASMSEKYA